MEGVNTGSECRCFPLCRMSHLLCALTCHMALKYLPTAIPACKIPCVTLTCSSCSPTETLVTFSHPALACYYLSRFCEYPRSCLTATQVLYTDSRHVGETVLLYPMSPTYILLKVLGAICSMPTHVADISN